MPPMPASLQLRLKKGSDGRIASFALHRADGSVTVMRNPHAFFPIHDLTHYAVETTLHHRRGFYGLVCEGWNFEDFGSPWPRGRLPAYIYPAESIVGLFDLERATGFPMSLDELNRSLREKLAERPGAAVRPISLAELDTIRRRISDYAARWRALPPGETLTLDFTPGEDGPE